MAEVPDQLVLAPASRSRGAPDTDIHGAALAARSSRGFPRRRAPQHLRPAARQHDDPVRLPASTRAVGAVPTTGWPSLLGASSRSRHGARCRHAAARVLARLGSRRSRSTRSSRAPPARRAATGSSRLLLGKIRRRLDAPVVHAVPGRPDERRTPRRRRLRSYDGTQTAHPHRPNDHGLPVGHGHRPPRHRRLLRALPVDARDRQAGAFEARAVRPDPPDHRSATQCSRDSRRTTIR